MNITFRNYDIEIQLLRNWYFKPLTGHELVANYIEYFYYFLCFGLLIRKVGIERENIESIGVWRNERRNDT